MFIGYTVIVLCAFGKIGAKAELYLEYEDTLFETVDSTYFNLEKTDAFITDDNKLALNLSIVTKFPPEAVSHFELLGLAMGEYVVSTGIKVTRTFCEMVQDPIIYGPFFTQMGMSADLCPPEPGDYIQEGYTAALEQLPDTVPENRYVALFDISFEGNTLLSSKTYLDARNY